MYEVRPGMVYLVGAGPGDPGLITVRGQAYLSQAQVVLHDRLIDQRLLDLAVKAELIDVGKQPDCHPVPQEQINALLIEKARQGCVVVRLKGGDPFVFGRGGEEALALIKAGLPFEIVPGVTSGTAAPAYAGIPVTHRGVASSVAFITGHCAASSGSEPSIHWQHLAQGIDTLVFLMGVQNLSEIVENLLFQGRPPDTPVAVIQQGTYATQKTVTGTLQDILSKASQIQPPAITVVGEVVRLRESLQWFEESRGDA